MSTSKPPPHDDDRRAFRRAMAGVRPLPQQPAARVRPKPRPVAKFARAGRDQVLLERQELPPDTATDVTGDGLLFRRRSLPQEELRKLRRGRFAIEAEIDLHGLGRHAAHDALRQFLAESVLLALRCVRVIHGKGLRSGFDGPVLRHAVDLWLRKIENVEAFASARPADGGTGAVYVLLSARDRR